ncbi:hypothetical protein CTP10_R62950 (plasmid) [Cupriavidus sp. P-10]|uniref:hypothetical protein n=1 Tax=Cupriavidus sp. P-10 TaxID=2027911 RepID=UPI000EEB8ACA|nr:hypothetical protein [Cupriavidus sp. P-10]BDB28882.1 hypothetical protein CTP10_R62950 [Cupriavidus sp. P-10]
MHEEQTRDGDHQEREQVGEPQTATMFPVAIRVGIKQYKGNDWHRAPVSGLAIPRIPATGE